jgi:hypothetical protein
MTYYDNIAFPALLARKIGIDFWEFEIALDVRPTLTYPGFTIPELHDYHIRMVFNCDDGSEQNYAVSLQLMTELEKVAMSAESEEDINFVIKHLPSFYTPAHDIISEKRKLRTEPERLARHKKLMLEHSAVEKARLSVCETAQEAFAIATRITGPELPWYDTHTEAAFLRAVELADDIEMLKEINQRSLIWHSSRFAALRKMLELPPEKRPDLFK